MMTAQMNNDSIALTRFQILASRICDPIFDDDECELTLLVGGLTSSIGKIQLAVARAWMQMPFSPEELCLEIGRLNVDAVYLCRMFGWDYQDLFLDPAKASDHEALAGAVVGRNPVSLALVLGGLTGEIVDCIDVGLDEDICLTSLKYQASLFVTASALLANMHGIDFVLSCLPETIDWLKSEFPEDFDDVAPMERATKKSVIYTGKEARH
jgi:hypothetical protein